jgi:hypothetical protein
MHDGFRGSGESSVVHLGSKVVMVEDEFLAEQSVPECDEDECVRRIVRVNDIEAVPNEDEQSEEECGGHRVAVLEEIADESVPLTRSSVPEDPHSFDDLGSTPARWGRRDYGNLISSIDQCLRFTANAPIVGIRVVFKEHQDAPTS